MVKINLLDIKEDRAIFEKGSDLSIKEKPAKEGREFSLESVDELFKSSQTSKQAEPRPKIKLEKSRQPAPQKNQSPAYSPENNYKTGIDEEESFDHFPRGGKVFAVVIIIVLIVVSALLYFFVFGEKAGDQEQPGAEAAAEDSKTDGSSAEATSQANPEVLNFYSQNSAKSNYNLNLAQNLMRSSGGNIQMALIVLTPDQIQFSILADSRDALGAYQSTLKQQFSNTPPRLIESYDMNVAGSMKIGADFILALKNPGNGPQVTNFKTVKSGDLQSTFNTVAQKYQLRMEHFKKGQPVNSGQFNQVKFYCNLSGNRDTIINFLREVTGAYPAISISKIALYPSGSAVFTARMTLILNEARIS